jgi:hypothetical protein
MKRLGVRYAGWFNRKYGRIGHLFQDRFKSLPVEDDAYFVTLLRYVWNNPVEAGLVTLPEEYIWSSRRLLGRESPLVDGDQLRKLLPADPLAWVTSTVQLPTEPAAKPVRRPGHSQEQVTELLRRACGANTPEDFLRLDEWVKHRAIRELRTRSVAYAQIAKATGMSTSTVRRLHATGPPRPSGDGAMPTSLGNPGPCPREPIQEPSPGSRQPAT